MPETVLAAGDYQQDEATADGVALTPGYLVEPTANGVAPHSTDAGDVLTPMFVREHTETGMGIDDDVPAGSNAKYLMPTEGSRVRARIAADEDISPGDVLVSAGDGTLRESAVDGTTGEYTETGVAVGTAVEAGGAVGEVDLVEVRV